MDTRWVRVVGDGAVYLGPCLVHSITLLPNVATDYCTIYDGRDATSGKPFLTVISSTVDTHEIIFPTPVPFDQGIYVDAFDAVVETTIVFTPL